MPRSLVLGNGKMLVCLDQYGFLRDLYFPYVGLENHVLGKQHRIGIDVNGTFSWLNDTVWQISLGYLPETMVGYLVCKHPTLGVSLVMEDIVYNESNVFVRKIEVYNQRDEAALVKLFFNQEFLIQENNKRNTAFYDPTHNVIVHYKGRRVFIVNGRTEAGEGIDQFTVGTFDFEGKEGSFRDAENGELSRNAVEHGSADSVVRFSVKCEPQSKSTVHYWIAAGKSLEETYTLNELVLSKTPQAMLHSTESFWRAWLNKRDFHTGVLTQQQKKLFDTSLFVLRAHCDNSGSIIASADSAMMEYGKDDYAYMWPRDAAFIASTLDQAGFTEVTKSFYRFCQRVLHPDGYLHHRFRSDESLGSTWHSSVSQQEWLKDKILQLPIQEDETAGVLVALWKHYEATKDLEFIEELYKPLIEKMGDFLVNFRNKETGLPLPSYDLWEEKIGISTYTCAAVYGGLMAAARFSEVLDKRNHMREFAAAATAVKEATIKYLYDTELGAFVRTAIVQNGQLVLDKTVDSSSLFGLWYFEMLDQTDPLFQSTKNQTEQRLTNPGQVGGFIRYEHDRYFRSGDLPNPWFITTLWDAQRRLHQAEVSTEDLEHVKQTLEWVTSYLSPSGVLAEQLGEQGELLSATPLVWSHAVWIETVLQYSKVLEARGECPDCTTRS